MGKFWQQVLFIVLFLIGSTVSCRSAADKLDLIKLPPGFVIDIYTDRVPGARSMAVSPAGTLFVGTRSEGRVYAVLDMDHDHKAAQSLPCAG